MKDLSPSSQILLAAGRQMLPALHAAQDRRARQHIGSLLREILVTCAIVEGITLDELVASVNTMPCLADVADQATALPDERPALEDE